MSKKGVLFIGTTKAKAKPLGKSLFDLHITVGQSASKSGMFYAEILLGGQTGVLIRHESPSPAAAISKVVADIEAAGAWSMIASSPGLTNPNYIPPSPVGGSSAKRPDPNAPKKPASSLANVAYPDCQVECKSFDLLGPKQCKSMCRHRNLP